MLQAMRCIAGAQGLAAPVLRRAACLTLDWDLRQKSRFECTDSQGRPVAVFLPRGQVLRGGDALLTQDGTLLRVLAAPQAVLRISACPRQGQPLDLVRAAYHLGNRHVPTELQAQWLQIEPDHVLAEMLTHMGLHLEALQAPFEPEAGAYGQQGRSGAHAHAHAHSHAHGCAHDHG